mmetsp:Transcript_26380/g.66535  ORF Transcript_26380/g.66535 Transcript_26380/m.66535 type:complete len:246 (-) Transcript_26380:2074-2811(-)
MELLEVDPKSLELLVQRDHGLPDVPVAVHETPLEIDVQRVPLHVKVPQRHDRLPRLVNGRLHDHDLLRRRASRNRAVAAGRGGRTRRRFFASQQRVAAFPALSLPAAHSLVQHGRGDVLWLHHAELHHPLQQLRALPARRVVHKGGRALLPDQVEVHRGEVEALLLHELFEHFLAHVVELETGDLDLQRQQVRRVVEDHGEVLDGVGLNHLCVRPILVFFFLRLHIFRLGVFRLFAQAALQSSQC